MNRLKIKSLLLALAITMIITGLLLYYIKQETVVDEVPMVSLVVATENIPPKTIITDKHVREVSIPEEFALPGSVKQSTQAIGKITRDNIFEGEQVLQQRLVQGREEDGLSAIIPDDYRAITIKVDSVSSVGRHVKTGDLVDILVYLKPPTSSSDTVTKIFEKIEVLDAGLEGENLSGDVFMTFRMKPKETETLFLMDELGKLRLVLRPITDYN